MVLKLILCKFRSFWRLPFFVKAWLIPVWLLLGTARMLIYWVPFRKLAPWLGANTHPALWVPLLSRAQEARAMQIGEIVRFAARYTPWASLCFPQALVARLLLGIYHIPFALFLGVASDSQSKLQAHAWVVAGRVAVTGGKAFNRFTTVGCFVGNLPMAAASMPDRR